MTKKRKLEETAEPAPATKPAPPVCVILDLDHTLLHSRPACALERDEAHCFELMVEGGLYKTKLRPFAIEFWKYLATSKCVKMFGVWTAGTPEYATRIVEELTARSGYRCDFLLDRLACTQDKRGMIVKDLAGFKQFVPDHRVVLIDDSKANYEFNRGGVVRVAPFFATKSPTDDCVLQDLMKYPFLMLDAAA